MRYLTTASFVASAAVWFAVAQAEPVMAQSAALAPNPQIHVSYVAPKLDSANPNQFAGYEAIYAWLKIRQPLEEIQKFLAPLRLPRAISIQVDTCGAERRPYVSGGPVTICYELIDKIQKAAAATNDANAKQMVIVGTFTEVVLHELSYAIFDVLQVPVWGRMEDAADRLAAFVIMQFSEDVAHTTMLGVAEFFLISNKTWTGVAFATASSPEAQRFFNFLCMAYGADSQDYGGWTEASKDQDPLLPKYRAEQCANEYAQVRNAFSLRIMPFVDPDLLLRVKASQWFRPGELSK